ncbi:hypothetical protein Ga0466249_002267 [Sporomusaceae bacterium BoRhaA]|uniref:DUF3560 domain-containing protein n=1 Tax=Pelorhabdus rhamnosifermentans TaxID=2772457 RepID=UPI001C061216|nr:DUF3560 domain-containing protein [Pelorhabdus rhamnosifermentans]MBU2701153.1 hypothetical protein [Pelorhabdus rhamnosifermentans]
MRLDTKEKRQAARKLYIDMCKGATVNEHKDANCVIVTYEVSNKPYLMIFDGTAGKPSSHYYYRSFESRQAAIEKHLESQRSRLAYKAEQKAKNKGQLTGAAATAKAIRTKLKEVFPEVKFFVTSENFAGGDSVHISWIDGPVTELVDRIVGQYEQGHFNGMEDIYEYRHLDTEKLGCPGAKYIMTSREQSEERKTELQAHCRNRFNQSIEEAFQQNYENTWYYENRFPECWEQKYQDMKAANDEADRAAYAKQEEERRAKYEAEHQEELQEISTVAEVLPEVNEVSEVSSKEITEVQQEEKRPLNSYEQKLENRRQRYLEFAANKRSESKAAYNQAHKMAEVIPFGQPILVGHHSERSDRNYRNKISNKYEKSFKLSDTANYYEQKAASVGTGGISSDDPDAIIKLKAQLEQAEKAQETMKAVNKAIRKNDDNELYKLGYTDSQIAKLKMPDSLGRVGFANYALTNNNANIHRIKQRIEVLERNANKQPVEVEYDRYTYKEDDNRCQFIFDGKPADNIREVLKHNSFKWSPSRSAWVRQLTGNGKYAARRVMEQLKGIG